MNLLPLPALSDNYIWLLHNASEAVVVDPGEDTPVLQALEALRLTLRAILVTHHHGDHVGGVGALQAATGAQVYAPARELPGQPRQRCQGGDRLTLLDTPCTVIDVPGHTAGHIAYWLSPPGSPGILLCGDTLFSGGCGRLFEGTPAQMLASLQALAALPADTRVCCAHEYTLSNLRFALAVEPGNTALIDYHQACTALRAQARPTLPSTIGQEHLINPFLRVQVPAVAAAAAGHAPGTSPDDPVAVLAALREWKNGFR